MATIKPGSLTIEQPQVTVSSSGVSGLSGAQNATLVLGAGLVAVSIWSDTLSPLLDSAWNGTPLAITLPAAGILAEVLFIGALVFVGSLSDDFAQLAFWFILALWALYLVMHPSVVTTAAGWMTQNSVPTQQAQQGATTGPSTPGRQPNTSSY